MQSFDVAVVGGGLIGMSVAWRARQRGLDVVLLERAELGAGTSRVAAGMLAPVSEVEFGEAGRRLLALTVRSAELWPAFAAELERDSGLEVPLRDTGTLLVARDDDEAQELERQLELRRSLGLGVERLLGSEARRREPALAPTVRLALEAPGERSVEPRHVLAALRAACERAGVRLREHAPLERVRSAETHELALELAGGELVRARELVLATGPWSGTLSGLPEQLRVPVRPVKGQIMELRDPAGGGLLERTVRFEGGYLVPRGDGRYVLGATVEERGFELEATAGGVRELLRDAHELVPGVDELQLQEVRVGLRPGTPDNLPIVGRLDHDGPLWATGHHRNGVLLTPLTAELVLAALDGAPEEDEQLTACSPRRFARALEPVR